MKTVTERFEAKIQPDGECWRWVGSLNNQGYGQFWFGGKVGLAHRFSYEYHVAPIPEGLVIDHLCRNSWCVNPFGHLDPVPMIVNTRRGLAGHRERSRTHCPQGHPYDEENTYVWNRQRFCRACINGHVKRRYHEKKMERVNATR